MGYKDFSGRPSGRNWDIPQVVIMPNKRLGRVGFDFLVGWHGASIFRKLRHLVSCGAGWTWSVRLDLDFIHECLGFTSKRPQISLDNSSVRA